MNVSIIPCRLPVPERRQSVRWPAWESRKAHDSAVPQAVSSLQRGRLSEVSHAAAGSLQAVSQSDLLTRFRLGQFRNPPCDTAASAPHPGIVGPEFRVTLWGRNSRLEIMCADHFSQKRKHGERALGQLASRPGVAFSCYFIFFGGVPNVCTYHEYLRYLSMKHPESLFF